MNKYTIAPSYKTTKGWRRGDFRILVVYGDSAEDIPFNPTFLGFLWGLWCALRSYLGQYHIYQVDQLNWAMRDEAQKGGSHE